MKKPFALRVDLRRCCCCCCCCCWPSPDACCRPSAELGLSKLGLLVLVNEAAVVALLASSPDGASVLLASGVNARPLEADIILAGFCSNRRERLLALLVSSVQPAAIRCWSMLINWLTLGLESPHLRAYRQVVHLSVAFLLLLHLALL